jgi:hypothetical protein
MADASADDADVALGPLWASVAALGNASAKVKKESRLLVMKLPRYTWNANGYTAGILYLLFARSVWKQGIRSLITHTDSTYPCDLSPAVRRASSRLTRRICRLTFRVRRRRMSKLMVFVKKRSDMTCEQFKDYWLHKHSELEKNVFACGRVKKIVATSSGHPRRRVGV